MASIRFYDECETMVESSKIPNMTVDEYLSFEESSSVRHEYVDGQVFAMSGSTEAHNVICVNLLSRIHSHLRGTGCRAFLADMKVHVKAANCFYYPDIMVTCDPLVPASTFKTNPVLIVEVLSPSTKQIDRREKLVNYRKIDTLRQYILIAQNKMSVENYRKNSDDLWSIDQLGKFDELLIDCMPGDHLRIPVQDIYEDLDLPSVVEESEEEEYDCTAF
jgi:Uma2 family endonuclease